MEVPIHVAQESIDLQFTVAIGNIYLYWTTDDDGARTREGEIVFRCGTAYRFTDDPCCSVAMIDAYEKVMEVIESPWVTEFAPQAKDRLGEPIRGLRHFMFYADGIGCYEVLAKDVRLHLYSD